MSTKPTNSWIASLALPTAGATLVLGIFAVATAMSPPMLSANAKEIVVPSSDEILEISPLFGKVQSTSDELPIFLLEGDQRLDGILPETARLIGVHEEVAYWIASGQSNDVCLISLLPGKDEFAVMTCQRIGNIWKTGIGLQFADSARSIRVYFLPSGYPANLLGFETVGTQLLVGSGWVDSGPEVSVAPVDPTKRSAVKLLHFDRITKDG